jgi:asparagine synthase (glutamine-hydrolysing)
VSAIAACYHLDGRPASADDLRVPAEAAAHRARGPFRFWCSGPVALAYGAPDHAASCQPYHDRFAQVTAIVDGRLDNRDELASSLGLPARDPVSDADARSPAALAIAAYRRWGSDAGAHLLGDFVVVIWDERQRRLVCIRDPMGQRPLFYGVGLRSVVIGSEPHQVVRHGAVRTGINEGMIAEYLTDAPETMGETLWRHVLRLPAAHALTVDAQGARVARYWDFDPDARVRFANVDEYAERFRDLFTAAVDCRLKHVSRAGVLLSGGIDSSCVAGVAHLLTTAAQRAPVEALSVVFPGRSCDETPHSDAVIGMWSLPATRHAAMAPTPEAVMSLADRYLDMPGYPNGFILDSLRDRAAAAGIGVVLTGFGGDEFFAGSDFNRLDLLRQRRVLAFGRSVVSGYLSERLRVRLRPVFGARPVARPWIRPEFKRRVNLDDRLRIRRIPEFPTREQQEIYRIVTSLAQAIGDEVEDRAAHAAGIEQRHPFYDRRVAEFGLALPCSQRALGTETKVIVRRALRDRLPPSVAARADKAEFSATYVEALEAIGGRERFAGLQMEDAGWVDGDRIRRMYDEMIQLYSRGDDAYIALTGPLWAVAGLEIFLARPSGVVAKES